VSAQPEGIEIVAEFLAPVTSPEGADVFALIGDRDRIERLVHPEAEITFEVPYTSGAMGDLAGPWVGPEGFIAGWEVWLTLWSEFRFTSMEPLAAGEGGILLLADCEGTLRDSGLTVKQGAGAVYAIRDARISGIRHFLDRDQAREAAGLE
jgi:ketosteroid isomerase-like protein